jgi:hypothetical protein
MSDPARNHRGVPPKFEVINRKPVVYSFPDSSPIFWGPNQLTIYPNTYVEPVGEWKDRAPLANIRVVRCFTGTTGAPPPTVPPPPPHSGKCATGNPRYTLIAYRFYWNAEWYIPPEHPDISCCPDSFIMYNDLKPLVIVDDSEVPTNTGDQKPSDWFPTFVEMGPVRKTLDQNLLTKGTATYKFEDRTVLCAGTDPTSIPPFTYAHHYNALIVSKNNSALPMLPAPTFGDDMPGHLFDRHGSEVVVGFNTSKKTLYYFYDCGGQGYLQQLPPQVCCAIGNGWSTTPIPVIPRGFCGSTEDTV